MIKPERPEAHNNPRYYLGAGWTDSTGEAEKSRSIFEAPQERLLEILGRPTLCPCERCRNKVKGLE